MVSDDSDEDALAVFLIVTALEKSQKTKAMHIGPAVVTKSANSGSLSCAAERTTVLGPEESPQLFVHGRRVVRSTHSEGGATHHTTDMQNA